MRISKRQRREVDLRVLMEQAFANDEEWKYVLLKRKVEDLPLMSYENYTKAMLDYLQRERRLLRNAIVHGGKSRHLQARLSEGHLMRVLSDVTTMHDKTLRHPIWAEYLLYLILPKTDRDVIAGDLVEEFRTTIVPKFGSAAARFWFIKQVLSSVWPLLKNRLAKALGLLSIIKLLWR